MSSTTNSAPVIFAMCGFGLVCLGLLGVGAFILLRATGSTFIGPMLALLRRDAKEDRLDDALEARKAKRTLPAQSFQVKAQSLDFDSAVEKYRQQGSPPAGASAQSAAPVYPAQNAAPVYPPQNPAPVYPPQNPSAPPQYPAQNVPPASPIYPPQNPAPVYPPQKPSAPPQYPAQNVPPVQPRFPLHGQVPPQNVPPQQPRTPSQNVPPQMPAQPPRPQGTPSALRNKRRRLDDDDDDEGGGMEEMLFGGEG
jgi:hypothetical protein